MENQTKVLEKVPDGRKKPVPKVTDSAAVEDAEKQAGPDKTANLVLPAPEEKVP